MKKSNIWIRICVHLLLFITLGVHSSKFDVNPVTDDIRRLPVLRQNIPKDYKIPVHYVPKEEGGMCWVKLNVFYLEESLTDLKDKFGNISSNKKDIMIFINMLQELRLKLGSVEPIMYDFECHYRIERWQTEQYFDYVKDFLLAAAESTEDPDECDPRPCPTPAHTETTQEYIAESPTASSKGLGCALGCKPPSEQSPMTGLVERSLLSLLLVPLLALVFLLVWKVRSRRSKDDVEQHPAEGVLFTGPEGTAPPLDADISEKNKLSVIDCNAV